MSAWFGQPWQAAICMHGTHVATPIGQSCGWCGEEFSDDDSGVIVPYLEHRPVAYHRNCFLRQVVGSVRHQLGVHPCDDAPELTVRQAADAAVTMFYQLQRAELS